MLGRSREAVAALFYGRWLSPNICIWFGPFRQRNAPTKRGKFVPGGACSGDQRRITLIERGYFWPLSPLSVEVGIGSALVLAPVLSVVAVESVPVVEVSSANAKFELARARPAAASNARSNLLFMGSSNWIIAKQKPGLERGPLSG